MSALAFDNQSNSREYPTKLSVAVFMNVHGNFMPSADIGRGLNRRDEVPIKCLATTTRAANDPTRCLPVLYPTEKRVGFNTSTISHKEHYAHVA
eukprot:2932524-Amphidinium_carterae.1